MIRVHIFFFSSFNIKVFFSLKIHGSTYFYYAWLEMSSLDHAPSQKLYNWSSKFWSCWSVFFFHTQGLWDDNFHCYCIFLYLRILFFSFFSIEFLLNAALNYQSSSHLFIFWNWFLSLMLTSVQESRNLMNSLL